MNTLRRMREPDSEALNQKRLDCSIRHNDATAPQEIENRPNGSDASDRPSLETRRSILRKLKVRLGQEHCLNNLK
jgi:hypothetical protein